MSKNEFFKRAMFIGPGGHSFGQAEIDGEGFIRFKALGDFGNMIPVMRSKDMHKYLYVDLQDYDPKIGDSKGKDCRIFFFDLKDGGKFSFKENSPAQIQLENVTLKNEILHYQNSFQKLLKLIQASSIDDYQKKMASDIVKEARSLTSYNPGGPIQTNNK